MRVYQNLWGTVKALWRWKLRYLNAYINQKKEKGKSQISTIFPCQATRKRKTEPK